MLAAEVVRPRDGSRSERLTEPRAADLAPADLSGRVAANDQLCELRPVLEDGREGAPISLVGAPFDTVMSAFAALDRRAKGAGGSGIVVGEGIIVTNNHVVQGGGKVVVRLHDGREFEAVEIKSDPNTDLALLWIDPAGRELPVLEFGDSDQVEVGSWAIAIGNPFGLGHTVTAGIISAKGRGIGITAREDFLQTDAAVNPGNSGGPLVDIEGKVVGINTAIVGPSYQGISFAIPSAQAEESYLQLREHGFVERGFLGSAGRTLARSLGLIMIVPVLLALLGCIVVARQGAEETAHPHVVEILRVAEQDQDMPGLPLLILQETTRTIFVVLLQDILGNIDIGRCDACHCVSLLAGLAGILNAAMLADAVPRIGMDWLLPSIVLTFSMISPS